MLLLPITAFPCAPLSAFLLASPFEVVMVNLKQRPYRRVFTVADSSAADRRQNGRNK